MSDHSPRRSSRRQRSHPPHDFENLLNGHNHQHTAHPGSSSQPPPTQTRPSRDYVLAPLFMPPSQRFHAAEVEGPALPPLSFERTTAVPQQPLPPLRALNRGMLLPPPSSLPHLFTHHHPSQDSSPPPLSAFPRLGDSQTPAADTPPFGLRYSRRRPWRRPSLLRPGASSFDEPPTSLEETFDHSSSYPYAMSSRAGASSADRRDSLRPEETARVNKRRKIEADKTSAPVYKAFLYGRYGQVEPGALKMEIASCDGGLYKDGAAHAAENILKADNSVYCTKGNRCNIVLQHQGNTAFSLKELIIKAPARNYSYPVREGMVFLSMSKDELLEKDQYHSNTYPILPTSLFQQIGAFRQRAAQRLNDASFGYGGQDENYGIEDPNDIPHEMYRLALDRTNTTTTTTDPQRDVAAELDNAVDPPTFYVMTECSDDEDGDPSGRDRPRRERAFGWRSSSARWSPARSRRAQRARYLRRESTSVDESALENGWGIDNDYLEDDDDDTVLYGLGDTTTSSPESPPGDGDARSGGPARGERDRSQAFYVRNDAMQWFGGDASAPDHQHTPPSLFENRSSDPGGSSTPDAQPDAEFHIEKHKNKCTIRFNPPVTTRYILLKMWNPHHDIGGNIDIQGVVAKGFAGPRFFPAKDLR